MVNFQQNTSTPNSAVHRGIRPWSSGIHPMDARMVWHREINKYDNYINRANESKTSYDPLNRFTDTTPFHD